MYKIQGVACKNKFTKMLVEDLCKTSIAVIKHRAIDVVAAQDLANKNVRGIINCEDTLDIRYSLDGVVYLLKNNISLYDMDRKDFFDTVQDGDIISLDNYDKLYINKKFFGSCRPVTMDDVITMLKRKRGHDIKARYDFIKNTIYYMDKELNFFIYGKMLPALETSLKGREVVIISRGRGYREDLKFIKKFIIHKKPVIISVDGGANAVTDIGLVSDIIIGDMDSVSDNSLLNCHEIIVHSYSSGYAPGLERINSLKLKYKLLNLKGTSEDAAIYMAKLKGASTIYLVGGHMGIDEFLEKGRQGMGSTALLRMLLGDMIVDLKGVSHVCEKGRG